MDVRERLARVEGFQWDAGSVEKNWRSHQVAASEFVDWSRAQRTVLPNLRPSTRTISLRLPEHMIEELKLLANKRDVPYQSLLKIYLAERIEAELRGSRHDVRS